MANIIEAKVMWPGKERDFGNGPFVSATFLPVGMKEDKDNFVYVNADVGSDKADALFGLGKGRKVMLVEGKSRTGKPKFDLAEMDPSQASSQSSSQSSPVPSQEPEVDEIPAEVIASRAKSLTRCMRVMIETWWAKFTNDPDDEEKSGLGMSPAEAMAEIRNLAVTLYIESGKTHRRDRY